MLSLSTIFRSLIDPLKLRMRAVGKAGLVALCWVLSVSAQAGPGAEKYNEFLEKGINYPD